MSELVADASAGDFTPASQRKCTERDVGPRRPHRGASARAPAGAPGRRVTDPLARVADGQDGGPPATPGHPVRRSSLRRRDPRGALAQRRRASRPRQPAQRPRSAAQAARAERDRAPDATGWSCATRGSTPRRCSSSPTRLGVTHATVGSPWPSTWRARPTALHLGEFRTHDPDALWAVPIRENLEARFREMTLDAAEYAVELGWMRDALELGQRALDADATSERAYRVLMRAFAGLGETERALRDLRAVPRGARRGARHRPECPVALAPPRDPHLRAPRRAGGSLHGAGPRAEQPAGLVCATARRRHPRRRVPLRARGVGAHPSGPRGRPGRSAPGSSVVEAREDLAAAVAAALTRRHREPASGGGRPGGGGDLIVLVRTAERLSDRRRGELLTLARLADGPADDRAPTLRQRQRGGRARRGRWGPAATPTLALHLLPLAPAALEQLATAQLCGPPSPGLLDELFARSEGLPGRVLSTVDDWCHAGEIAVTSQGLELVPPHDGSAEHGTEQTALLVRAMEATGARDQHVLHLVALLDRPVRPALLGPLMPTRRARRRRGRGAGHGHGARLVGPAGRPPAVGGVARGVRRPRPVPPPRRGVLAASQRATAPARPHRGASPHPRCRTGTALACGG